MKPMKKPNHDPWKARMCGRSMLHRMISMALSCCRGSVRILYSTVATDRATDVMESRSEGMLPSPSPSPPTTPQPPPSPSTPVVVRVEESPPTTSSDNCDESCGNEKDDLRQESRLWTCLCPGCCCCCCCCCC